MDDLMQEYIEEAKEEVQRWDDEEDAVEGVAEILWTTGKAMRAADIEMIVSIMVAKGHNDVTISDIEEFLRWAKDNDTAIDNIDEKIQLLLEIKNQHGNRLEEREIGGFVSAYEEIVSAYEEFEEDVLSEGGGVDG